MIRFALDVFLKGGISLTSIMWLKGEIASVCKGFG